MDGTQFFWQIVRKSKLPIAEFQCQCTCIAATREVLEEASGIIQIAEEYGGYLITHKPDFEGKYNLIVGFSIMFMTEEDFEDFITIF